MKGPSPCKVSSNSAWMTPETSEACSPVHCAVRGISFGVSVGVSTLSMTWMTPLLVATSASVTFAPLTMTPSFTVNESGCPLTASALMHSVTAVEGTLPATTWYWRMLDRAALPSGVSREARSISASMNAWSVGAKTVNGPVPWRVSSNSAWRTAATSES